MIAKLFNLVYVFFHKFLTAFILPYLGLFSVDFKSPENKRRHVIMITGCDTGFGYLSAKKLIAQGFTVIANCLTKEGAARLKKECTSDHLHTMVFDVTDLKAIEDAYAEVARICGNAGLYGLVNNAGIANGSLLDLCPLDVFFQTMAVNFDAIVYMCKIFLPLLKTAGQATPEGARVINIASVAGRLGLTGTSNYSGSKFAVEGFSDAIRRELSLWNIKVVIFEPAFCATPMVMTRAVANSEKLWLNLPQAKRDEYGEEFRAEARNGIQMAQAITDSPDIIVNAIVDVYTKMYPKTRYSPGLQAKFWLALSYMPSFVQDALVTANMPIPASLKRKKQE